MKTISVSVFPVVARADDIPGPAQGRWTYNDYAKIPDDGCRYEVVEGVLYRMTAPSEGHQASDIRFGRYLFEHVEEKGLGRVYVAPFDVELAPDTVVQPDVIVVLKRNESIIHPSHIIGAPDLVVEIASPSTATHDRRTKLEAYARAGVSEYWIADAEARTVELLLYSAASADYESQGVFHDEATLPSRVVPALPVAVDRFFA